MAVMLNMLPVEPKNTGVVQNAVNKGDAKNAKSAVGFAKLLTNETDKNALDVDTKDQVDSNAQLLAAMSGLVLPVVQTSLDQGQGQVVSDGEKMIGSVENQLTAVMPEVITPPITGQVPIIVPQKVQTLVAQENLSVVPNLLPKDLQNAVSEAVGLGKVAESQVANMVATRQKSPLANIGGLDISKEQVVTEAGQMSPIDPLQGNKQVIVTSGQGKNQLPNVAQTPIDVKLNPEVLTDNPALVNVVATTPLGIGNGLRMVSNASKSVDSKQITTGEVNPSSMTEGKNLEGITATVIKPVVPTTLVLNSKDLISTEPEIAEDVLTNSGTKNTDTFVNLLNQQGMKIEQQTGITEAKQVVAQPVADPHHVTSQIVDQARLVAGSKNTEMIIQLKPEHLGELTFKVSIENGVVSASFHSNNSEVRNVIESSLYQLKQEMANQGLKVDNVGVYAGLGEFFSNGQQRENAQQPVIKVRNKKNEEDFIDALEGVDPIKSLVDDSGVDYRI